MYWLKQPSKIISKVLVNTCERSSAAEAKKTGAKKKNTLVSANVGDEENLHPTAACFRFFLLNLIELFGIKFKLKAQI